MEGAAILRPTPWRIESDRHAQRLSFKCRCQGDPEFLLCSNDLNCAEGLENLCLPCAAGVIRSAMTYRFPSLNGLKAFEAAARHLSFKSAAAELGVTPGAVSQQVKRLEASLGISLFRRLPQGLLLTDEGEAYRPGVSQAFDLLTDATEAIAPALNGRKMTVGVAQAVLSRLAKGWPRHSDVLDPYIREARVSEDVGLIWENELDALVLDRPVRHGSLSEQAVDLGDGADDVYFVTRPGLATCRQSRAIIEELPRKPLV
ncbi:MAG: LysR family transcriptional regulator [Pseudomonadota bacterium]